LGTIAVRHEFEYSFVGVYLDAIIAILWHVNEWHFFLGTVDKVGKNHPVDGLMSDNHDIIINIIEIENFF
jgi:hypothetical protein